MAINHFESSTGINPIFDTPTCSAYRGNPSNHSEIFCLVGGVVDSWARLAE
jgi:hypothetical protein